MKIDQPRRRHLLEVASQLFSDHNSGVRVVMFVKP